MVSKFPRASRGGRYGRPGGFDLTFVPLVRFCLNFAQGFRGLRGARQKLLRHISVNRNPEPINLAGLQALMVFFRVKSSVIPYTGVEEDTLLLSFHAPSAL